MRGVLSLLKKTRLEHVTSTWPEGLRRFTVFAPEAMGETSNADGTLQLCKADLTPAARVSPPDSTVVSWRPGGGAQGCRWKA